MTMQPQFYRNSTALLTERHRPGQGSPHTNTPSRDDISKHLESLRARLGFARFKMRNGWEKSTLVDVEYLWRQKQQQQMLNDIPKPRFTQQDIIEKGSYIQSPSALCAKAKKTRLTRTLSSPAHWFKEPSSPAPNTMPRSKYRYSVSKGPKPYSHPRQYPRGSNGARGEEFIPRPQDMRPKKRSPTVLENVDEHEPCMVRNSLDYLSYAIAMTEGNARNDSISCSQPLPDVSRMEPNLLDDEMTEDNEAYGCRSMSRKNLLSGDETESDDDTSSAPNSSVTAAAHAIMMFVNSGPESTASV